MNDSTNNSDPLYTNTNKFIMVIDSRNADTYNNGSSNSDMTSLFQEPIMIPKGAIKMTCAVLAFTAPNSIYLNHFLSVSSHFVLKDYYFSAFKLEKLYFQRQRLCSEL